MSDLIDTTEMYLRTIYELVEEGIPPMRARIAERLHQSGPTVSQTVARMERDGLLTLGEDRVIALTGDGSALAEAVMRKHRLAERLLVDVIGLDWELVHAEACRWEHVISDDVERRLVALLDDTTESPYGNPIPAMDALGASAPTPAFRAGNQPLPELVSAGGQASVRLVRMSESVQADDEVLRMLAAAGVRPGAELLVRDGARQVEVEVAGSEAVELPAWVAEGLFAVPA